MLLQPCRQLSGEDDGIFAEVGPSRRLVHLGWIVRVGSTAVIEHGLHRNRHQSEQVVIFGRLGVEHQASRQILTDASMHPLAKTQAPWCDAVAEFSIRIELFGIIAVHGHAAVRLVQVDRHSITGGNLDA